MTVGFDLHAEPVALRDAATIVLLRDGPTGLEVFFVKRRADVRFMGGAYVFPGGKLDAADADPSILLDLSPDECATRLQIAEATHARALHVAALRECFEESGVLLTTATVEESLRTAIRARILASNRHFAEALAEHSFTLRASAIAPLSRWVTPRAENRRFDTRFFLAGVGAEVVADHDQGETVASCWLAPHAAIERAQRQEIVLVPPTYRTVQMLAGFSDVQSALAHKVSPLDPIEPSARPHDAGGFEVLLPDHPEHPAHRPIAWDGPPLVRSFRYCDGVWTTSE
ncbi:MAG: NUDIX domain-containing protein [Deltaproteobacteria bacterium]|nr:NUDIX domain-containing protein [Deltaproteobacteria bacterium]